MTRAAPVYMGSFKGATGPTASSARAAAAGFFASYPSARKVDVRPVESIPGSAVVVTRFDGPSWKGITRATLETLPA